MTYQKENKQKNYKKKVDDIRKKIKKGCRKWLVINIMY